MSLAKANLRSKVPLRGILGYDMRPRVVPRTLNIGIRSINQARTYNRES
jgi:hypothetical protein